MMTFIVFIGVIVIFIMMLNLRGRVKELEYLIKNNSIKQTSNLVNQTQTLEKGQDGNFGLLVDYIKKQIELGVKKDEIGNILVKNGWQVVDIEKAFNSVMTSVNLNNSNADLTQNENTTFDKFVDWVKEDWMLKLGSFLLLIGFGWLTTYAFLNNWIGPVGRIALGVVAGILFLILGWWRIRKYIHQGGIFLVLGSTTILLTIFAAREIYGFFTPFSALVIMFLSTIFVALGSVKYNNRTLALTSLVLAGVAPLLSHVSSINHIWLFSYLLVVIFGTIWVVILTEKRELTLAGLLLVIFYSMPHLLSFSSQAEKNTLLIFAYLFAIIFFLTNTIGIIKLKDKKILPDLITASLNGLFLLSWIMVVAQQDWKSTIIFAWMIVFFLGAFLIYKITQRRDTFWVYSGVGIAMLAAATSVELSGATLTIFYTIECGIIALITYLILKDVEAVKRISLLLLGPIILSFGSMTSRAWMNGVFHKDFFVLVILGITFLILGLFFLQQGREEKDNNSKQFSEVLLIVGSIYAYIILWFSLHAELANKNTAVMISLVIYTIVGLISYFYGLLKEKKDLKIYGGVIIGLVVGRLLLVDVWGMELTGKIATFFLIGALLVSTAFLGNKKKKISLTSEVK